MRVCVCVCVGGWGWGGGGMGQKGPTPVIIVEKLANFFFPSPSKLILKLFMPKQTHKTNIEGRRGNQYIPVNSWHLSVYLVFSGSVSAS